MLGKPYRGASWTYKPGTLEIMNPPKPLNNECSIIMQWYYTGGLVTGEVGGCSATGLTGGFGQPQKGFSEVKW